MKEIEILVDFDNSKEEALKLLQKFEFLYEKEIHDIYYMDQLRDNLKPEPNLRTNEIMRLRKKGDECMVTYKKNNFEGNRWTYSDEYETNAGNFETMQKIIEMLGLEKQIEIKNKRRFYKYSNYEIVFEEVEDLGLFLEVERMIDCENLEPMTVKSEIREFIKNLGFKNVRELDLGKNQLMLREKLKRYDIDMYINE